MANDNTVLLAINDLIFETKVRATGQATGVVVRCVRSAAELSAQLEGAAVSLVVIDLNSVADAIDAIQTAITHDHSPRVLAFVSHVDTDLARRARDAGAHDVLPRSRFVSELPALLAAAADS